ncbi:MAG TPA: SRPBCC domain-containing protein [Flavobacteriales bacterium]|nr:SRPBCC domain-containing protein [Flavobacteriales bacterium]
MDLIAKADIKIQNPIDEVFEAIIDQHKLAGYFVSSSNGRMEPGATLTWRWDDANAEGQVVVDRVEKNTRIVFRWGMGPERTTVTMELEKSGEGGTKVRVEEDGWAKDDNGIASYAGNTRGWTNFLDCLKAFLEYGINLRKGAFF